MKLLLSLGWMTIVLVYADTVTESTLKSTLPQPQNKRQFRQLRWQKIVGGSTADIRAYPSYAVPQTSFFGNGALCGSVKIWDDVLLSAAHCAGVFRGRSILIGGNQRTGSADSEIIPATIEMRHPDYNDMTLENDFMLIKLDSPSKAPNAPWNKDPSAPRDGEIVSVIGYGTTTEGGSVSDVLLTVDVAVVAHDTCNSIYLGRIFEDTMLCAYRAFADSCQGDRYVFRLLFDTNLAFLVRKI